MAVALSITVAGAAWPMFFVNHRESHPFRSPSRASASCEHPRDGRSGVCVRPWSASWASPCRVALVLVQPCWSLRVRPCFQFAQRAEVIAGCLVVVVVDKPPSRFQRHAQHVADALQFVADTVVISDTHRCSFLAGFISHRFQKRITKALCCQQLFLRRTRAWIPTSLCCEAHLQRWESFLVVTFAPSPSRRFPERQLAQPSRFVVLPVTTEEEREGVFCSHSQIPNKASERTKKAALAFVCHVNRPLCGFLCRSTQRWKDHESGSPHRCR